jgi:hypothetical protein
MTRPMNDHAARIEKLEREMREHKHVIQMDDVAYATGFAHLPLTPVEKSTELPVVVQQPLEVHPLGRAYTCSGATKPAPSVQKTEESVVDHGDAIQLAHIKKGESNLARCYIDLDAKLTNERTMALKTIELFSAGEHALRERLAEVTAERDRLREFHACFIFKERIPPPSGLTYISNEMIDKWLAAKAQE